MITKLQLFWQRNRKSRKRSKLIDTQYIIIIIICEKYRAVEIGIKCKKKRRRINRFDRKSLTGEKNSQFVLLE